MALGADLRFTVSVPGRDTVHGSLRGGDDRLVLDVDDAALVVGAGDAATSRSVAEAMAARGILVRVVSGGVHLASVGAVTAPWWHRLATGSRRIRIGSLRGLRMVHAARRRSDGLMPDLSGVPRTPLPLSPTFGRRRPRPRVTTTHDPARGGSARLVMVAGARSWVGQRQAVFALGDPVTSIGCEESCDIVLPGLRQHHATVEHDEHDEYVLVSSDSDSDSDSDSEVSVNGVRGERLLLRTGSLLRLGDWVLSFTREEYADHGRPHGGRVGGEFGHQRRQAPRTEVQ